MGHDRRRQYHWRARNRRAAADTERKWVFLDLHDASPAVAPEKVVDIAVPEFAAHGYADTKLDHIARESGMSKRMIHYHFGDKLGLYTKALSAAIARLHPPEEELKLDTSVPVEGVRRLIDAMVTQFVAHPECLRLLVLENLNPVLLEDTQLVLSDESAMMLYLDRLLMLGQDSGAFRPGISAADIYALISSITFYRIINRGLTRNLFDIDMANPANTAGLHRMVVDAVLAFLTANIPDSGNSSYLSEDTGEVGADGSSAVYDESGSLSDSVFGDD